MVAGQHKQQAAAIPQEIDSTTGLMHQILLVLRGIRKSMPLNCKLSHPVTKKRTACCLLWTGRLSKALTKHNMRDNLQELQV